jgi:hypothetical protein
MIIFYFITNYNQLIFRQVLISEAILVSLTIYVLWRIRRINRIEQERCELFHSTYLLKTILSKQREYRNCFQVIRAMAEGGKNQEIVAYIDDILDDISSVEDFEGLNLIFTAYHVAEEIKAREKGVKVTTITRSTLTNIREPLEVFAIFKDLLQYFVAYEETIVCDDPQIKVEVSEDDLSYYFKIMRNNGAVEATQESNTTLKLDRDHPLRSIAKRLKKLGGKFYPFFREDELIGCQFIVGKVRDYRDLFPLNFGT